MRQAAEDRSARQHGFCSRICAGRAGEHRRPCPSGRIERSASAGSHGRALCGELETDCGRCLHAGASPGFKQQAGRRPQRAVRRMRQSEGRVPGDRVLPRVRRGRQRRGALPGVLRRSRGRAGNYRRLHASHAVRLEGATDALRNTRGGSGHSGGRSRIPQTARRRGGRGKEGGHGAGPRGADAAYACCRQPRNEDSNGCGHQQPQGRREQNCVQLVASQPGTYRRAHDGG